MDRENELREFEGWCYKTTMDYIYYGKNPLKTFYKMFGDSYNP